ncbi:Uncharacterised protein [Mycobacteroides abscessus subsp. abscessus]|nr:Uncharacterised protein [Mycobacteroides abscessus subsp. abscessus]
MPNIPAVHRHLLSLTAEPEPHRPLAERRLRRRVKVTRGQRGDQLVGSLGVPLEDVLPRRRLGVQVCVRNLLADKDSHCPAVYPAQVRDQIARRPSRTGRRVLGEMFGRGRGDGRDPLAQCFQPFVGGHAVIRSLTRPNLATISDSAPTTLRSAWVAGDLARRGASSLFCERLFPRGALRGGLGPSSR